jgi:transcriptional regulator with XRE-family HTH domain
MSTGIGSRELGQRIRRLRTERRLTLKQLERACGLSATHLSEIERGRTSPTIGALARIARALGRNASYFIEAQDLPDVAHVPRAQLAGFVTSGGVRVEPLTPGVPGNQLFAYRLLLQPADSRQLIMAAQEFPGEALYLVLHGQVETGFGEMRLTLGPGDAAQARFMRPHALRALDGKPAELIAILTRPLPQRDG